ncbi:hypothetical protein ABB37_05448 [Leptomonas pyrrhocoris]|uniref:Leucine-rich repeat protein (LRRP) n=1 Tax=Leptomonas pyrrhocoris TaxID=157538 RepID=A0A0M9G057_LEPPY|nr:hypothetical protein ABB37_05448 [Leptomonas pyrrhocoris]KPA79665.1 hypothetical protein ABB37_05448 [Leptomonas pyrrhocoris]|eukprot:XP_015658104.1 hypothetical protein ABB37_05448 [Leptomonas pyrrhocoris]
MQLDATTVVALRELACDHRHLTALHPHFTRFEQLDSLVLSHNALRTLHNLLPPPHLSDSSAASLSSLNTAASPAPAAPLYRGCHRLTRLHVSHNKLRDLAHDTDIPRLRLLEHLTLAHNQLTDLDCVLQPLRRLHHLRYVDLRGNPIVDEPAYRPRCIAALPQVEVLDGLTVTAEERRDAAAVTATDDFLQSRLQCTFTAASRGSDDSLSLPADTKRGPKQTASRFAKSAIAKDFDARYAAQLRQQAREKAAAVEARAAAERQREETREAFHAVWTLSQPGMPLSMEKWRTTMAAEGAGGQSNSTLNSGGDNSAAAAVGNAASRPGRKSPSQQQQQPSSTPGGPVARPRTPFSSRSAQLPPGTAAEEEASGTASVAVKKVEVPRDRLLPLIAASQQHMEGNDAQHESPYFGLLRGTGKADATAFSTTLSNAALEPSPVRLAAIQQALQASTRIIRTMNSKDGSEAADATHPPALPPASAAGAVEVRRSDKGSLPPGCAATFPVDVDVLRVIQRHKHALIPPPWEQTAEEEEEESSTRTHKRGDKVTLASSLGRVQQTTVVQEALVEVLVLLHQLFSSEELQLLEREYGRAELLRLLPLQEWSPAWESAADDTTSPINTLYAARVEMLLLSRPGGGAATSGGGGGGSGGSSRRATAEDRKKAANGAGRGGGAQGSASVAAGSPNAFSMRNSLTAGELAATAMLAARAALPTEPQYLWNLFVHPLTAGAAGRNAPSLSQGKANETAVSTPGSNVGGASAGVATPAATATATAGTSADESALHDPEVLRQLVRPIGPYEGRVLGSLLKLLKPPPSINPESLCDDLRRFHAVTQHAAVVTVNAPSPTAAAAATAATAVAPEASRGSVTASKSKKEAATPSAVEAEGSEGKRRLGKGTAGGSNAHRPAGASVYAAAPSNGHEHGRSMQQTAPPVAQQLSLLSILTALLFHPAFVRGRLQHWEQELVRRTMAAATTAADPTAATTATAQNSKEIAVGSTGAAGAKTGSLPPAGAVASATAAAAAAATTTTVEPPVTALSRLFHRVQELKSHVARVEEAAAAEVRLKLKGSAGAVKPVSLVNPSLVLLAYQR